MEEKFEGLQEEKRQRILSAAIEEFALNGYDKASTNTIVKNANVSKGLLFHYFESKKNLFLYLFDYCIDSLMDKYGIFNEVEAEDIFERLMRMSLRKMKGLQEEPLMSRLVVSAISNMPEALKDELTERYKTYYGNYLPKIFKNLDTSQFKKGIDSKKAVELVMICMDGLSSKYLQKYNKASVNELFDNIDEIMEDFNKYIDILKFGIY